MNRHLSIKIKGSQQFVLDLFIQTIAHCIYLLHAH